MTEPVQDPVAEFEASLKTPEAAQQYLAAAESDPQHTLWALAPETQTRVYRAAYGTAPAFVGDGTIPVVETPPPPTLTKRGEALALLAAADQDPAHPLWSKTPEARRELYRLAYPEPGAADGSTLPPSETPGAPLVDMPALPAGESWAPEFVELVQASTQDLGLAPAAVGGLLAYVTSRVGQAVQTAEEAEATLRAQWGAAYEANLRAALVFTRALPQGIRNMLDSTGFANDPGLVARFAELGAPFLEAQELLAAAEGDRKHPFWSKPEAERAALYRKAYGRRSVPLD
jgi:hypothetical protein